MQKTAGEASTLRRRLTTVAREHDLKLRELRDANDEILKRQKDEIQRLKQQHDLAQTNNMFTEHDRMADKTTRIQRNQVTLRTKQSAARSPSTTPKRQQKTIPIQGGFGDGFDEEDMATASPSRARAKSKTAGTPKQANKRKRQVFDQSPIPALQLSEPRERTKGIEAPSSREKVDTALLTGLKRDDHRFQLLHRLVNNRSSNGKDRVLEALTQYAFPSESQKTLSSIFFDELSVCGLEHNVRTLALKICSIFLALWEKALEEAFYDPVYLFLDALHFILAYEPSSTAIALSDRAVPLIMRSIDLVSIPIADAGLYGSVDELFSPEQRKISASIDSLDCLDLLYLIVSSCVPQPDAIAHIWQLISFDFILVLVRSRQPLPTVKAMLRILSTSALPHSIGAIHPPPTDPSHAQLITSRQERRETELLERLTSMLDASLSTIPDPLSTSLTAHQYSPSETLSFRLQIITLLTSLSIPQHGNTRMHTHPLLLGRLISFLHSQISSLYAHPLSPTHALTITTINATFNLVYHLITSFPHKDPHDYSNLINEKLAAVQGGQHKFMVGLTRLAFSEGVVLESGIGEEVIKGAEDLLDGWLTGPEGEALLEVFEPGGSGGSGSGSGIWASGEGKGKGVDWR